MSNYGDPEYWDNRYTQEEGERFDWLEDYQSLQPLLAKHMIKGTDTRILNIGCGNGQIQDKLYDQGYHNITNNDISTVVVKQMRRTSKHPGMVYEVMDVCDMNYKDQSFDLVLDKSTIDALLCSDNPLVNVVRMMHHIYRVLVEGGLYFLISYGNPASRLIHMSRSHVNFDIKTLQIQGRNGTPHYVYICQKKGMVQNPQLLQDVLLEVEKEEIKLLSEGLDPEHGVESEQLFCDNEMKMFES